MRADAPRRVARAPGASLGEFAYPSGGNAQRLVVDGHHVWFLRRMAPDLYGVFRVDFPVSPGPVTETSDAGAERADAGGEVVPMSPEVVPGTSSVPGPKPRPIVTQPKKPSSNKATGSGKVSAGCSTSTPAAAGGFEALAAIGMLIGGLRRRRSASARRA